MFVTLTLFHSPRRTYTKIRSQHNSEFLLKFFSSSFGFCNCFQFSYAIAIWILQFFLSFSWEICFWFCLFVHNICLIARPIYASNEHRWMVQLWVSYISLYVLKRNVLCSSYGTQVENLILLLLLIKLRCFSVCFYNFSWEMFIVCSVFHVMFYVRCVWVDVQASCSKQSTFLVKFGDTNIWLWISCIFLHFGCHFIDCFHCSIQ